MEQQVSFCIYDEFESGITGYLAEVNPEKESLEDKLFEFLVTKLTMDPEMVLQLHRLESFSPACFVSDGTAVGQAIVDLLCSTEIMFVVIQKQRLDKNSFDLLVSATHSDCVCQTVQKIDKGYNY
ncbi:MAG: hypothetical protein JEZ14_25545 [Marinilabiliaceae bacterium]|nr:hypothetical protein [Marinilabiliaceae bacterium]